MSKNWIAVASAEHVRLGRSHFSITQGDVRSCPSCARSLNTSNTRAPMYGVRIANYIK
jgi:hypothetical protein